jgi:predicted transcriptional regulator
MPTDSYDDFLVSGTGGVCSAAKADGMNAMRRYGFIEPTRHAVMAKVLTEWAGHAHGSGRASRG